MNYRDLIGINNSEFHILAYINNFVELPKCVYMRDDYRILIIYGIINDAKNGDKAICSVGKDGAKELYDIKTIDGEDFIVSEKLDGTIKHTPLKNAILLLEIVGKLKDNKIYPEYFRQGHIYKNELVYLKTKNLPKEELDKLPIKDKICYIPESSFDGKEYINLSDELEEGSDYYTVQSIREDIKTYFGSDIMDRLEENNIKTMVDDVFYCVDWQHLSSLLDADQYLDGYIEELGIDLSESEMMKEHEL